MSEQTSIPKHLFDEYDELIKLNKRLATLDSNIQMPEHTDDESFNDYIYNLSNLIQNLIEMKNILCSIELKKIDIERQLKEQHKNKDNEVDLKQELTV